MIAFACGIASALFFTGALLTAILVVRDHRAYRCYRELGTTTPIVRMPIPTAREIRRRRARATRLGLRGGE